MIEIFRLNNRLAYTNYRYIAFSKNLEKLAEIILCEVDGAGEEIEITFLNRTLIKHKHPEQPELFSCLTEEEIKEFWEYYKKLAEATL